MRRYVLLGSILALAMTTSCTARSVSVGKGYALAADVPQDVTRDMDILFVIDNSNSMADEVQALGAWAAESLFDVLTHEMSGSPNVHIALVTTDVGAYGASVPSCTDPDGDNGIFQTAPMVEGCSPPDGSFLVDVENSDGTRTRNFAGSLGEAFRCITPLVPNGCGYEQPLESMRRALDGTRPENAGFLRENALLLVVVVTDEDDCSANGPALFDPSPGQQDLLGPQTDFRCFESGVACEGDEDARAPGPRTGCRPRDDSPYLVPLADYVSFLTSLKKDPTKVMVAGIFGPPEPVTVTITSGSYPALVPVCGGAANCAGQCDAGVPLDQADAGVSDAGTAPPLPSTYEPVAYPAVRLKAFLDAFPTRSRFSSICAGDVAEPLARTARLAAGVAMGWPCVAGRLADTRPEAPGVQPLCYAYDAVAPGTASEKRTEIPACTANGGAAPCFTLEPDATRCGDTETGLAIVVRRTVAPPVGTHVILNCYVPR